MKLTSLTSTVTRKKVNPRSKELENALKGQMNLINSKSYFPKKEAEEILLRQKQFELWRMEKGNRFTVPKGLVKFTPSGASACKRNLFYKAIGCKQDESDNAPYNNRWTRNSTSVHEATQRDILYAPFLLEKPNFTVNMIEKEGFGLLPAWEKVVEDYRVITHKGVTFVVSGMMDGLLTYEKDGTTIGFEFKTKSTNNQQIVKMKKPSASHIQQCVAYSLIFKDKNGEPVNDFLITYEAVAKDEWRAGRYAVEDIKTFHVQVTERQKTNLLNKFAEIASAVENGELPNKEVSKCLFCPYKSRCLK